MSTWSRRLVLLAAATALGILPFIAHAQDITISEADPSLQGDGTLSAAAAAAIARGRLRAGPADIELKAAVNRAHRAQTMAPSAPAADAGGPETRKPVIVGGHAFAGQSGINSSPPDTTGAIGPTRYIQLVNREVRIYNRSTHATIGNGTLNQLAGMASTVNSFDPQIIWDPTTKRFYYAMDSIVSSTDHKLSFGFSRTASPSNVTTDWCHYVVNYGTPFPDYPKLGDSRYFILIGVNTFNPNFIRSDLVAIGKPGKGTTCPSAGSLAFGTKLDLRDTANNQVFTPVPANQIDTNTVGYVAARNLTLPSTSLWFFGVSRNKTTGAPVFGSAKRAVVPSYTTPPDATQPTFTQVLDTLDARPTQAVQAINPDRSTFSFWVQHTINNGTNNRAVVRWYEINPVPAAPVVLRTGIIGSQSNTHYFNAAISPDRRVDGTTVAFGDSFVVNYNVSSKANNISPRIVAGSSFNGGALTFALVKGGVGPYRDFTCPNAGNLCRWGDYAAATPDPRPVAGNRGQVWGTNQYSGLANPPSGGANWRTWIFDHQP
jgi:hypothetical protein